MHLLPVDPWALVPTAVLLVGMTTMVTRRTIARYSRVRVARRDHAEAALMRVRSRGGRTAPDN